MPSLAARPVRLAASARPFSRSMRLAASRSPPVSVSAFLQSIIPAPVASRSAFTSRALISTIAALFLFFDDRLLFRTLGGCAARGPIGSGPVGILPALLRGLLGLQL